MDFDRVGSIYWISNFVVYLTALSEDMYSTDFDNWSMLLVEFFHPYQQKRNIYVCIYIYIQETQT